MNRKTGTARGLESLESRQMLAMIATLSGTQAIFTALGTTETLVITRASGGQLLHNRFAAGDNGFASPLDFNSILSGVQSLSAGATSRITFDGNNTGRVEVNDSARATAGTYQVALNDLTLPDGTQVVFNDSIDNLDLSCGSGSDTVNLTAVRTSLQLSLLGNNGNDTLNAGNGGSMDALQSQLTDFDGGAGTDKAVFNDENDTTANASYNLIANFSRTGAISMGLTGVESRELRTTNQADIIDIGVLGGMTGTITVLANGGADDIDVTSVNTPDWSAYTIDAGGGDDYIRVISTGNKSPQIFSGSGADSLSLPQPSGSALNLVFDHSERFDTLSMDFASRLTLAPGGDNTLVIDNAVTLNGVLDINDNTVILKTPPAQSVIRSRIQNVWNSGGFDQSAITAITSGVAKTTPTLTDTVGYGSAAEVGAAFYAGQLVSGDDLIVTYTRLGDTNLNQTVEFTDLLRIAQNYGAIDRQWSAGNLNYDSTGRVDFTDLLILAQNYGQSLATTSARSSRVASDVID